MRSYAALALLALMASAPKRSGGRRELTIVGGGVAALELLLAARAQAEERVDITVLSPQASFDYRPLSVAEPFGLGVAHNIDIQPIVKDAGAHLRPVAVTGVDTANKRVLTHGGRALPYDLLAIATGAVPQVAVPGALTFGAEGHDFSELLRDLEDGTVKRLAFAVPGGSTWPLPLYELALLTNAWLRAHDVCDVELTLMTPEQEPLRIFGLPGSKEVRRRLDEAEITLLTAITAERFERLRLHVHPQEVLDVDRVVTLPALTGPALEGLPADPLGFIPIDKFGRVEGVDEVWAAGDVTNFPVKQGGLAAQQADAAASDIAARCGAPLEAQPFRPVLRGLLLTGDSPAFMRAEVASGKGEAPRLDSAPLWWPPGKIAGKYLSARLAQLAAAKPPTSSLRIEVDDLTSYLGQV